MSTSIHATAIIHDGAQIDEGCKIGAYSVIESGVKLGKNVTVGSNALLLGNVTVGDNVEIHGTTVIGGQAQVKGYTPRGTESVQIGARSIIRELATINAGHFPYGGVTRIGEDCFVMIQTHVAHDCVLGDRSVLANSAMLGGHVEVEEDVWIGAAAMVHQFQKIGKQSILGGGTVVVADVPPFCVGAGNPIHLAGINTRGLKRRNFEKSEMQIIRKAYKMIFEGTDGNLDSRITATAAEFEGNENVADLIAFIRLPRKRPLASAR